MKTLYKLNRQGKKYKDLGIFGHGIHEVVGSILSTLRRSDFQDFFVPCLIHFPSCFDPSSKIGTEMGRKNLKGTGGLIMQSDFANYKEISASIGQ